MVYGYPLVRREALNWFKEAMADLERARRSVKEGDWALAAFMCQQACEKTFKAAYLGILRSRPPHTHDLVVLYRGLSALLPLKEEIREGLPEVSQYYTVARYPHAGLEAPSESISGEQARRALRIAEEVVGIVGGRLEGSAQGGLKP